LKVVLAILLVYKICIFISRKSVLKLECAVPDLVPALNFVEQTGNTSANTESTPLVYV